MSASPIKKVRSAHVEARTTYFAGRGQGEFVRMALAEVGANFEDVRIATEEREAKWVNTLKPKMAFEQMPYLEMLDEQGKTTFSMNQSIAIVRYIGRKHHLYEGTPEELAVVDQIIDSVADIRRHYSPLEYIKEVSTELKESYKAKYTTEVLPKWFGYYERLLSDGRQWMAGNKFTIADLVVYTAFHLVPTQHAEVMKAVPKFAGVLHAIGERPNIKKWVLERPKSEW